MATKNRLPLQIEHVTIVSDKGFDDVRRALEALVPRLDGEIQQLIRAGDTVQLEQKLEAGPELSIFLLRDHGALLQIAGKSRKAMQYEIGNPLTASKMTRYQLAAGLYAPLRVILYEDDAGTARFEYDLPSSLFEQFEDDRVRAVAKGLDAALERALLAASG
jgi:uncharacterized protein (DUF302 family)